MKRILGLCLAILSISCQHSINNTSEAVILDENNSQEAISIGEGSNLYCHSIDKKEAEEIRSWLIQGQKIVAEFFEKEFNYQFDTYIFSTRESLDKQWQKDWKMPDFKSECWMVASGIAHRLDILSPRVWNTEACEHDSGDKIASKNLIIHELTHVYHGQYNPSPTFDNIENIDWLVEGVAVYVSGQLDDERLRRVNAALKSGDGPEKLSAIWKGENKYGFAGSIVKYIDKKYGREQLFRLLQLRTAEEVLNLLNSTEEDLIKQWKLSVK